MRTTVLRGACALWMLSWGCSSATDHKDARGQTAPKAVDPRTPVSMSHEKACAQKQHMMTFLESVEQLQRGLVEDDWDTVTQASSVPEASPDKKHLCQEMPEGTDAFRTAAIHFRCRADGIGEAAQRRDRVGVLRATSEALQVCNSCHRTFRQQMVTGAVP